MTTHTRLVFANLPHDCEDRHLRAWIEAHGYEIAHLRVIRDDVSFSSPNFAQVELVNPSLIDGAAHELNGGALLGKAIRVWPMAAKNPAKGETNRSGARAAGGSS